MVVRVAGFTDGNLVIFRLGDGVNALTNAGTPIFLDEYTTNGTLQGTVAMPTSYFGANSAMLGNGTAFGNGLITRSVDGRFILVTGYGAQVGDQSTSLGTTFATVVPRVVALVGGNGNIDSTTTLTNNPSGGSSGGETRGAVSTDGTNIWTGGDSLSGGGIQFTTLGSVDATNLAGFNTRQLEIYNNQLYLDGANFGGIGATGSIAILTNKFGTTLPTATNNVGFSMFAPATTNVFSPQGFALFKLKAGGADPIDTLYLLDSGTLTAGIAKFSLVGGNWVFNNTIGSVASLVGLAANMVVPSPGVTNVNFYLSGGGASLTGGDAVYKVTDNTGYNGDVSGNPGTFSPFIGPLATKKAFRGLVFAPSLPGVGTLSGAGNISVGPVVGLFANGDTGCALSSSSATQQYSVANLGTTGPISWQATCDGNWVTVTPASGSLNPGDSVAVSAFFNANVTSLPGSLDGVTNTATIMFTNTTSHIGDTTRAVRLIQRDQDLTPSTDYVVSGQPGGPFSPLGKSYTIFNGGTPITLKANTTSTWANVVIGTTTGSSVSVSLAGCAKTNVSVVVITNGVGGANSLTAGNYADVISFSNTTASTLIDTRSANLTVGGIFFCDDFSAFTQNANIEGQQGWAALNANPQIGVSNNAVWQPASTTAVDEPWKNIPVTTNGNIYQAMVIVVESAPANSIANPLRMTCFFLGQNETSFAVNYLTARDTGTGTFVFGIRKNGAGNATVFGTTAFNYGSTNKVIVQADASPSDSFEALYVNPVGAPTDNVTNGAYVAQHNIGALDVGVASFSLQGQFTAGTASAGYHVYKVCITPSATAAFNDLASFGPPADPFATWQSQYFGGSGNPNAAGTADPDLDGMSNTNEFLAGFDPTNSTASVRILNVAKSGSDMVVTYRGANGNSTTVPPIASRTNVLEATFGTGNGSYTSTNFASVGTAGATNILSGGTGVGTVTTFTDVGGASGGQKYYRVRVLVP
jgi:hypothetical protein